jgi:multidrug efflux system membrane fusion protein
MPGTQQSPNPSATPDISPDKLAPPIAEGRTAFIDNTVDPTTGTLKMKAVFPNSDRALWPGLFVQVSLNLTTDANALVVPAAAIQTSQTGQFVYVVTPDRTADLRPVTVERQQGSDVVIASGLQAGEEVVTDGQLRLVPGARVGAAGMPEGAGGGRSGRSGRGGGRRSNQGTGAGS